MIKKFAYYFPGYHPNSELYSHLRPGWSEWELVRNAKPLSPDHYQPRVPLWGYEDETDQVAMKRKLELAKDYGISFLMAAFWYFGKSAFSRPLEVALNLAAEHGYPQPAMVWANHNRYFAYPERADQVPEIHLHMDYSWETCKRMVDYWVTHYFSHPGYCKLSDGRLFFTIYSPQSAIRTTGSSTILTKLIQYLRNELRANGLPEIHIHASETRFIEDLKTLELGFDSCSDYISTGYSENRNGELPHLSLPSLRGRLFVDLELEERLNNIRYHYQTLARLSPVEYFPVVVVGRDCSPRVERPSDVSMGHFSLRPIIKVFNPEVFRRHCLVAKEFIAARKTSNSLLFLTAWNEWTEGSYLEPDTVHKYGFLNVVREVFD